VIPVVTAEEKEKGLKLTPNEKSISVDGSPVLDIVFS
jgi:hypothetical protein